MKSINLTIEKKFSAGSGHCLSMLALVCLIIYFGMMRLAHDAAETIDSNLLDALGSEPSEHIITDGALLSETRGTNRNIMAVGLTAVIVGIFLALNITQRIPSNIIENSI